MSKSVLDKIKYDTNFYFSKFVIYPKGLPPFDVWTINNEASEKFLAISKSLKRYVEKLKEVGKIPAMKPEIWNKNRIEEFMARGCKVENIIQSN